MRRTPLYRLWIGISLASALPGQEFTRDSRPAVFSYAELVELGLRKDPGAALSEKLQALLTTPFVNNEAFLSGSRPRPLDVKGIGPSLRVALWNIERGLELDDIKLMLSDKERFIAYVAAERARAAQQGKRMREIDVPALPNDVDHLRAADVWILNEADWGLKRSHYREVVREIAEILQMNWAYGVEFVEVDSKQLGTDTFAYVEDPEKRRQLLKEFEVDPNRLRALHGNAVLSRYPIRSARLVPFKTGYNWFQESKIRPLEKGKRKTAVLVGEDLMREVRRGQRTTLYVDLDVPNAPLGSVTIAATHLENRAKPKLRRQQMKQLLEEIHEIPHAVIVAGDLNTTGANSTPTSIENMLIKRYGSADFWTTQGIQWLLGIGPIYTGAKAVRSVAGIQYRVDPTSANLPGISPNLERGLFNLLEKYRFADGDAFDFQGLPERSIKGRKGTLGNSNERAARGFAPSFITELIWGRVRVARFKLDWILVKASEEDTRGKTAAYQFAPHFARTLTNLNNALPQPISDHSPMTVDLPFIQVPHRAEPSPQH